MLQAIVLNVLGDSSDITAIELAEYGGRPQSREHEPDLAASAETGRIEVTSDGMVSRHDLYDTAQ